MNMYKAKYLTTAILLSYFLLTPTSILAKSSGPATQPSLTERRFIFDQYFSPYSSSLLLMSTRTLLNEGEDYVFSEAFRRHNLFGRALGSFTHNFIVNPFLMVFNHEVHGHGFRVRSFGLPVVSYTVQPFSGSTVFHPSRYTDANLLIIIGGCEADNVMAQQILLKHFKGGGIDGRTYGLFFWAYCDLPSYIYLTYTSEKARKQSSNDISIILEYIKSKHKHHALQLNDLAQSTCLFLFNPVLYTSIWYSLIYTCEDNCLIPHLQYNDIKYMPLVRMGLTPFGIMYYLDNYVAYQDKAFLVSLHGGTFPYYSHPYGGVSVKTCDLVREQGYGIDLEGEVWYQPGLLLSAKDQLQDKNAWGGMGGISGKVRLTDWLLLNASLLYKTQGFVEGVPAQGGVMLRGGFSLCY